MKLCMQPICKIARYDIKWCFLKSCEWRVNWSMQYGYTNVYNTKEGKQSLLEMLCTITSILQCDWLIFYVFTNEYLPCVKNGIDDQNSVLIFAIFLSLCEVVNILVDHWTVIFDTCLSCFKLNLTRPRCQSILYIN